jgi:hypothetical protein
MQSVTAIKLRKYVGWAKEDRRAQHRFVGHAALCPTYMITPLNLVEVTQNMVTITNKN